jgi:UDP:flavonoid glycosyltransferase YjiC (YdhE family)
MRVLLIPYGSAGYVLPFIKLGSTLERRGHHVIVVACGYFRSIVEKEGLNFVESYPTAEYTSASIGRPTFWKLRQFLRGAVGRVLDKTQKVYDIIAEKYVPGDTVVASQSWVLGARIAQEKLGVPLATIHLSPLLFGSVHDTGRVLPFTPKLIMRLAHRLADRRFGPGINEFRRRLGLGPVSYILSWWHSPQRVIGLFPDWFAAPQPDWPANTELVGFPLVGGSHDESNPPDELDAFVAEGEPPLIFSHGSFMKDVRQYLSVSAEAARLVGCRAVLFTSRLDQIPESLPDGVRCFGFVPFRLPKRAAAHVHHGGIGTIAYTMAAGIRQLTVPVMFDQPDNCRRLKRLGVSESMRSREYWPRTIASKLKALLDSATVAENCHRYAAKCHENDALERAGDLLERLAHSDQQP